MGSFHSQVPRTIHLEKQYSQQGSLSFQKFSGFPFGLPAEFYDVRFRFEVLDVELAFQPYFVMTLRLRQDGQIARPATNDSHDDFKEGKLAGGKECVQPTALSDAPGFGGLGEASWIYSAGSRNPAKIMLGLVWHG
jgi:hypothetical protein